MARPLAAAWSTIAIAAALPGCGSSASEPTAGVEQRVLRGAQARPPAPAASAALTQIADGAAARRRLGYVNLARIGELRRAIAARRVLRSVLGEAGVRRLPSRGARTAVRVGAATVVRGPGLQGLELDASVTRSGRDGLVFGGDGGLREVLADARPEVNAVAPNAQSAVQSCLGDSVAQTIVGPSVMGRDSAIGAGLRASGDRPAGVQLAICFAPHFRRDIDLAQRRARQRFSSMKVQPDRKPVIRELEIGEREISAAVVPADAVGDRELLALLRGGRALRALGGQ